jgi:hypothetical protein
LTWIMSLTRMGDVQEAKTQARGVAILMLKQ